MNERTEISESINKLREYIERNNYKGYDPYDALLSPFFKLPILKTNKLARFGTQQLVKRLPFSIRPLLLIPKGLNPVTLGLCLQAYTNLLEVYPKEKTQLIALCESLITQLKTMIPKGFHGACWGYDFDWEARYAKIPAFQPTIVATGFITNALFKYYQATQSESALDLCKSSCSFVLNDIKRTTDTAGDFCFSYSPFDYQQVLNASMKGVRILSQVYSVTKDRKLKEAALKAVNFVVKQQQPDGSFFYTTGKTGAWVDNYHTGYVLDCLDEFIKATNEQEFTNALKKGFLYYKNNLFDNESIPKFFNNKTYPVDCTAGAQSILTLCRFHEITHAQKVALYLVKNMQSAEGYFYFRKYKHYTEKTSFMRWSNAWMFAGLTDLLKKEMTIPA